MHRGISIPRPVLVYILRHRGLEQQIALPRDSFLQPYFSDVSSVLRVGAPLFLVVEHLNMSRSATDVNRTCSVAGCDDRSLMNQVSARQRHDTRP